MSYFQFQDPWLFLLLAIIPLLIYRALKNRPATLHFSSLDSLKTLHRKGVDFLAATPLILRCLAIALLVTALARPQEGRKSTEILSAGVDILLAIDTSGSMQNYSWPKVLQKVEETLEVYPKVKGIQVLNDMGNYMFNQYAGRWIPDSPRRRRIILEQLLSWRAFSNSSPVEGIEKAIRTFHAWDKEISIYVFGDEFTGESAQRVIDRVAQLNRPDAHGRRLVRVHAVGFSIDTNDAEFQRTSRRFASLMRQLCVENGGTFVGL